MYVTQTVPRVSVFVNLHAKFVARYFLVFPSVLLCVCTKVDDLPSKYRLREQCFCTFLLLSVFHFSADHESTLALLLERVVPTKHCSTMYSRLTINFLNHFKCFCGNKTGVFALLILCSLYFKLKCPVRSPINILQSFLSSLLMNCTYLSVGPSRHSWLVPYF